MAAFLSAVWKKYHAVLIYLFFGVLTTAINYIIYLPCYNLLFFSAAVSNAIAWSAAVLFAFVTNKPFVFQSRNWSAETTVPEFIRFVGTRGASGLLETVILMVAVDVLGGSGNIWKVITSVLVVIANYLGSKLLVFRGK